MSVVTQSPRVRQAVSAMFTFEGGPVIAEGERIRPCGMDEIAFRYGEAALDAVMENVGQWVNLSAFDAAPEVRHVG